jgi:hypothetical protein
MGVIIYCRFLSNERRNKNEEINGIGRFVGYVVICLRNAEALLGGNQNGDQ